MLLASQVCQSQLSPAMDQLAESIGEGENGIDTKTNPVINP